MNLNQVLNKKNFLRFWQNYNWISSFLALVIFLAIAFLLKTHHLQKFDEHFLFHLQNIFPKWFFIIARSLYFLGEAEVAVFVVLLSLIILVWKRYWKEAQVLAASSLTVLLLVDKVLKPFFDRARPLVRLVENVYGKSFPSGHATGNLLLYLLLAYFLSTYFPNHKIIFYTIAILLLFLMGISSSYLRVHWITDIYAGYCVGYIMFTISLAILRTFD
jgi:undecaprenyl-diphosphatase